MAKAATSFANTYVVVFQQDDGTSAEQEIAGADVDWDAANNRLTILDTEAKPLAVFARLLRWYKKA